MDLFIYAIVLVVLGWLRVNSTSSVADECGIVDRGVPQVEYDLPIGNNLHLYKETGAYTLILRELGLM